MLSEEGPLLKAGDGAYFKAAQKQRCEVFGGRYRVNKNGKHTRHGERCNTARSRTRARGELAFHVVKRLRGHTKVRYRGLAKNTARTFAAFALNNLYLLRSHLTSKGT